MSWPRVAVFRTAEALREHLAATGIPLALDPVLEPPATTPFARPFTLGAERVGNRFCILPMEGWDGTPEGDPSDLTRRRWRHFGISGAKLIWGGEAVAVRMDGRANPHQLVLSARNVGAIARLREEMVQAHVERFGSDDGLLLSLQLTHSGRFARPRTHERPEPLVAYNHPVLDRRFPAGVQVLSDADLDQIVADFVRAGGLAQKAGFTHVDVKHCHGYLGHELLSAYTRPGRYGGSFENRTRFLREVVAGLRAEAPGLGVMVRLSCFDTVPWRKGPDGVGQPEPVNGYGSAFGLLAGDLDAALGDARAMLRLLESLEVRWVCLTAGSPYYNPHVQRPALFPPLDGYTPPEDPLRGVARHVQATAILKREFPGLAIVGSGYSYLQEYLPHVGQCVLREGGADFVGLGRMVLSYPELPADVLAGRPLRRKAICRTFSDCTTAPRSGLVSGCYPLDPYYTDYPAHEQLKRVKEGLRA